MLHRKTSLSFAGQTKHTTIVKDILMNIVGWRSEDIFLETSEDYDQEPIAFPFWTPSDMIEWILSRTNGRDSGTSGYLCYNNTEKIPFCVNVRTLNYLLSEKNAIDDADYIFEMGKDEEATQNKILDWSISGADQTLMKEVRGGTWRGYDSNSKTLVEHPYTFKDGISDTVLLGKKSTFPDVSDLRSYNAVHGNDLETLKKSAYSEWVKKYCLQFMVDIVTQGNEKRYAGHQIQIRWPSIDPQYEKFQKQLEGIYLVKSVTHSFTGHGNNINYLNTMRLIKNGFQNSSSTSLLNASANKKNITNSNKRNFILTV
jgi:hypothetical protein